MCAVPVYLRQTLAGDQGSEHQLWHVLGQWRDRCEKDRRRPAEKHRHRQTLTSCFRHRIVEATALPDLPLHPCRPRIVHLHAIDAEIVAASIWAWGGDERQRNERAPVVGPTRQYG